MSDTTERARTLLVEDEPQVLIALENRFAESFVVRRSDSVLLESHDAGGLVGKRLRELDSIRTAAATEADERQRLAGGAGVTSSPAQMRASPGLPLFATGARGRGGPTFRTTIQDQ
jgi:hypothetical protein